MPTPQLSHIIVMWQYNDDDDENDENDDEDDEDDGGDDEGDVDDDDDDELYNIFRLSPQQRPSLEMIKK